jgi:transglutaminase-like putative cysteine protease
MADARYQVVHTTEYDYADPVAVSHHLARLQPRVLPRQEREAYELTVDPPPAATATFDDYFGNLTTFFAVQKPHKQLLVKATSRVALSAPALPDAASTPPWETAADRSALPFEAIEFSLDERYNGLAADIDAYARTSFTAGRPLLDAVLDLTGRIHREFTFDPRATTVATPLEEVVAARRGVCQDFARFEIACLRSLGVAARYISGYLETTAPPGKPRLVGADASHAWLAFHCPGIGWIEVDPTNNLLPSTTHITLAWGRDYNDVSPIRGVILGGGAHSLRVRVDVVRLDS